MQLRTVVLGVIFGAAACVRACAIICANCDRQLRRPCSHTSARTAQTPPPGQWPVAAAQAPTSPTAPGQGTTPSAPARIPRRSPFPALPRRLRLRPQRLWAPQPAGRAFAVAAPRRNANASELKNGVLTTHDGLRLRLDTETGNIRIFTDATNEVRFMVRSRYGRVRP